MCAAPSNQPSHSPQPRLGIVHLLGWMLASGLILGWMRSIADTSSATPLFLLWQIAFAFCSGAALGGLLLWFGRRWRGGPPFPVAPGHWLLLVLGWRTLLDWLSYAAVIVWHQHAGDVWAGPAPPSFMFLIVLTPQFLITLLMWSAAAAASERPSTWEDCFVTLVIQEGLCLIGGFFLMCGALFDGLVNDGDLRQSALIWFWFLNQGQLLSVGGMLVLLAVWQDASRREPRDWLHWTGVAVYLSGTVIAWSWVLWLS